MPTPPDSYEYVLAELRARELASKREFGKSVVEADHAANIAERNGDQQSWWAMKYLRAQCLRDMGAIAEWETAAKSLSLHPLAIESPELRARALTLLAIALQSTGRLDEAVATAREATLAATTAMAADDGGDLHIQAQQALIAACAESGRLADAWDECLVLANLVQDHTDDQTAGKAYWVIGNVAFLGNRLADGQKYHDLASQCFSPQNDLALWARFNQGSAAVRLSAGLANSQTLHCIERAELATEIIGDNTNYLLQLAIIRANWNYLTGQAGTAVELLRPVFDQPNELATQTTGEAAFLLGRSLADIGRPDEALTYLRLSMDCFSKAKAPERMAQVQEFIDLKF